MQHFALLALTSVLFIVNPLAVIPTYLVITAKEGADQRAATARRACVAATGMLIAFALRGGRSSTCSASRSMRFGSPAD